MSSPDDYQKIVKLLKEDIKIEKENNILLKRLYRHSVIGMALRVVWYAILIGMPFAVYFYILEPYFEAFGTNYEAFRQNLLQIPGLQGIENILPKLNK